MSCEDYGEPWNFELGDIERLNNANVEFITGFERMNSARFLPEGKFHAGSFVAYNVARILAPKLTSIELQYVMPALADFQDSLHFSHIAGTYISGCIENSWEGEFELDLSWSDAPIHNLGMCNTRQVTIYGDVGDYLGREMRDGLLRVEGRYGTNIGEGQIGGEIDLVLKERLDQEVIDSFLFGKRLE
jgi:hypothetical protein